MIHLDGPLNTDRGWPVQPPGVAPPDCDSPRNEPVLPGQPVRSASPGALFLPLFPLLADGLQEAGPPGGSGGLYFGSGHIPGRYAAPGRFRARGTPGAIDGSPDGAALFFFPAG